jgi:hypothetical protein
MSYTKPIKVSRTLEGVVRDNKSEVSKSKPRDIPFENFLSMVRDRDRIFYKEAEQNGDIATMEFLKNRYGIK